MQRGSNATQEYAAEDGRKAEVRQIKVVSLSWDIEIVSF